MIIASLIASLILAAIHLFGYRLRSFQRMPRHAWLSFSGGISVSYIFVHLLPELHEGQLHLNEMQEPLLAFLDFHLYLIALLGLLVYYGLERHVKRSEDPGQGVFWVHIGFFALYNLLVGELLTHLFSDDLWGLLLYTVAMAAHFLVNDLGMIRHHQDNYRRKGRWVLAAASLVGWGLGVIIEVSHLWWLVIFSFVAGSTILNVLKEELPEEQQSNYLSFMAGALLYSALLIILL